MAEIITINRETVPAFLKRNGPTLTHEVASRFCLTQKVALEALKGLEEMGHVQKRRVSFGGDGQAGQGYEWTSCW